MQLEFGGPRELPAVGDFGALMASLAGLVALTEPRSRGYLLGPSPVNTWSALRFDVPHQPTLYRLRAESPVEIAMALPAAVAAIPALASLLYAAKRIFVIDLEFRAHRERMRINYLKARRQVEELESSTPGLEASTSDPDALSSADIRELITASKKLSESREPWQATGATITEPDDLSAA
jgi:hypothetical protein